jgi:DNA-binding CsgD family transcriptional regulator
MTDNQIKTIDRKLNVLIKLVALSLTADKTQTEQIALLDRANLQPMEIASLLGTTPNTVRVALSKMRKGTR